MRAGEDHRRGEVFGSLGVAKFDYKDRTLILYRSGRVDLRKIMDAGDAQTLMDELEALLSSAFE